MLVCALKVFATRQLKKLKLVFKNAAKVIDPVVILFSADKEISGTQSLWLCVLAVLPWISLYLTLPVAPAITALDALSVWLLCLCVVVSTVYHACY